MPHFTNISGRNHHVWKIATTVILSWSAPPPGPSGLCSRWLGMQRMSAQSLRPLDRHQGKPAPTGQPHRPAMPKFGDLEFSDSWNRIEQS